MRKKSRYSAGWKNEGQCGVGRHTRMGLTRAPVDWRRVEEEGQKDETGLDSVTNKSALGSQRRRGKGRDGWSSKVGGMCVV